MAISHTHTGKQQSRTDRSNAGQTNNGATKMPAIPALQKESQKENIPGMYTAQMQATGTVQMNKKGKTIGAVAGGAVGGVFGFLSGAIGATTGLISGTAMGLYETGSVRGALAGGAMGAAAGYASSTLLGAAGGAYIGSKLGDMVTGADILPPVHCGEGVTVTAAPNQGINFGGVTSCMTITCIMNNGAKVAAHEGLLMRAGGGGGAIGAINGQLGGGNIVRIIAAGGANYWSPTLQPQQDVIATIPAMQNQNLTYVQQIALFGPRMIAHPGNTAAFIAHLSAGFGVPAGNIAFTDYDGGQIQIMPDGTLVTG